jgi:hypothetical protein
MDPDKRSTMIEVRMADKSVVGSARFATDGDCCANVRRYARSMVRRTSAIEGCAGIGKHLAVRPRADGEDVVDVPPKLSARAPAFATGQGRNADATFTWWSLHQDGPPGRLER